MYTGVSGAGWDHSGHHTDQDTSQREENWENRAWETERVWVKAAVRRWWYRRCDSR